VSLGCPQGAKASTDLTYWPPGIRRGVQLETRCRVREITVGERHGDGVIYYDADGVERRRRPRRGLACNGIGTPRLLLNSRRSSSPTGSRTGAVSSART
jgi:choline dehydrogenase-like flavoprotein